MQDTHKRIPNEFTGMLDMDSHPINVKQNDFVDALNIRNRSSVI